MINYTFNFISSYLCCLYCLYCLCFECWCGCLRQTYDILSWFHGGTSISCIWYWRRCLRIWWHLLHSSWLNILLRISSSSPSSATWFRRHAGSCTTTAITFTISSMMWVAIITYQRIYGYGYGLCGSWPYYYCYYIRY